MLILYSGYIKQIAREVKALYDIEKEKAELRRKEGKNQYSLPAVSGEGSKEEKGEASEITARKLNAKSGREVERLAGAVEVIDELKEQNTQESQELTEIIEGQLKSPSTAHELAKAKPTLSVTNTATCILASGNPRTLE